MTACAPPPALARADRPRYRGPGYAEVKPHNVKGIAAGLRQLRAHQEQRKRRPAPGDAYLVTYCATLPAALTGDLKLDVYLLRPSAAALASPSPPTVADAKPWLDGLGDWWQLLSEDPGPKQSLAAWRRQLGPTVFGSMVEPYVRDAFFTAFGPVKRRLTLRKLPHAGGADVDWQEVAEFLYEVASELGDGPRAPLPAVR